LALLLPFCVYYSYSGYRTLRSGKPVQVFPVNILAFVINLFLSTKQKAKNFQRSQNPSAGDVVYWGFPLLVGPVFAIYLVLWFVLVR